MTSPASIFRLTHASPARARSRFGRFHVRYHCFEGAPGRTILENVRHDAANALQHLPFGTNSRR